MIEILITALLVLSGVVEPVDGLLICDSPRMDRIETEHC